ncbi:MAG: hypothetical protein M3511_06425, partial [Deinococcota bacterium]|nr:hypothetical protein [Deinococcota bacterium]
MFTFVPKPAKGVLRLTSGNVRGMLEAARSASQGLALPPITPDTPDSVAEAMHLHDSENRAPELAAELERRKGRALTIAFMHDDLNDIIKQRYAAYSRGSCLWSGDTE